MTFTDTYLDALTYTAQLHRDQVRKGNEIPYLSHLLAVSGLVWEGGGTQEQAIAGLLHDALEDQGMRTSYDEIADRFGPEVARIVRACSDTEVEPKPPWSERKQAYLEHLRTTDAAVLRVSLADKLHNARCIVVDGPEVWSRFKEGKRPQVWYYGELARVFVERMPEDHQAAELELTVERMAAM